MIFCLSDVGAHKMWIARMYQAERPNTCIISNGFASMGIALPGAIAAKLVNPDKNIMGRLWRQWIHDETTKKSKRLCVWD